MSNNVTMSVEENPSENVASAAPAAAPAAPSSAGAEKKLNLLDVEITSENVALNVLVGFLDVAQRRGVFALNESAKIFEAIKVFTHKD